MDKFIDIKVKVWRQRNRHEKGHFETYEVKHVDENASFLEMIDMLNDQLIREGKDPVVYDNDCREGICGACSMYVDGHPHGLIPGATTCQLYMRNWKSGDTITVEPWRSAGFPVIRDLMVDRSSFDKIQQAGGFISMNAGSAPDGNAIPVSRVNSELAIDAASCIGCGACSMYVDGHPHGLIPGATTCQLYMRNWKSGDTITVEPWRSAGFPVIRDLMVDRSSFDKIQQAGGFISMNAGSAPDGNAIPVSRVNSELAIDAASCIGCGACVAACKNGSAMLFVSAKVSQFALLPQGKVEAKKRARAMVAKMDELGFGNCTNTRACEMECPKSISISNIARLNREFIKAKFGQID